MTPSDLARAYVLQVKSRKTEIFMWSWAIVVGCLIAGRGFPPVLPTILTALSMLAIATAVYTYNDVTDIELDRLNPIKKNRAVPSGKISVKEAMAIVYTSGFVGVILSFFTNLKTFLLLMLWTALFLLYSNSRIRLKKRFLLKEGTIGIGFFLASLIGGMAVGSVSPAVIFSGIFFAAFVFLGFPAFRDTTDMKEDKLYGVKSLAVLLDWKAKLEMVILFILAVMTLTPLTYVRFNLNVIFPIVVVASSFLILRFLFPLLNRFEQTNYQRAYRFLFGFFLASQIALILGSLPLVF